MTSLSLYRLITTFFIFLLMEMDGIKLRTIWIVVTGIVAVGQDNVPMKMWLLISPLSVPQMMHGYIWSNIGMTVAEKIKELREKHVPVSPCPSQITLD